MSEAQKESSIVPFNRHTLPSSTELIKLIKAAQRHGRVHILRKPECAEVPKHKLRNATKHTPIILQ